MAVSGAWRFECCNRLLNALCDDEKSTLVTGVSPYGRRGSVGMALTISVHNNGRLLATCRHEVIDGHRTQWAEWLQVLHYHALRF